MKCSKCGFENSNDNKFCVQCGELLEDNQNETTYCIYCGAENPTSNKYCVTCGKNLSVNETPIINVPQNVQNNDKNGLGFGIASLATSIVCCCCAPFTSVLSIILGIIAIVRGVKYKNSNNVIGLILGVIGIIFTLLWLILVIYVYSSPEFQETYNDYLNMFEGEQLIKLFFK